MHTYQYQYPEAGASSQFHPRARRLCVGSPGSVDADVRLLIYLAGDRHLVRSMGGHCRVDGTQETENLAREKLRVLQVARVGSVRVDDLLVDAEEGLGHPRLVSVGVVQLSPNEQTRGAAARRVAAPCGGQRIQ
eukprot:scaffold29508_cov112-Isochrysis_galbana.AAC.2